MYRDSKYTTTVRLSEKFVEILYSGKLSRVKTFTNWMK